jgi:hypothetical protein
LVLRGVVPGGALVAAKILVSAVFIVNVNVNVNVLAAGFMRTHNGVLPASAPWPSERHLSYLARGFDFLKGLARKLHDLSLLRRFTGLSGGLAQWVV